MTRPWTPNVRKGNRTTLKLKRNCNGCGRALGDVTADDMDWSHRLPDVTAECGCDWDQPPGINGDDPDDRPDPAAAAERVLEFVKDFGDGRAAGHPDMPGVEPLYARDLEVLAKAYLSVRTAGPIS